MINNELAVHQLTEIAAVKAMGPNGDTCADRRLATILDKK